MTRTHANRRRPGFTLTEVLVALFVMALGLISLLTLFPLGALQIGLALRDDRCKQTAVQADALLRAHWQANVVEKPTYDPNPSAPNPALRVDDFVWAFDDPNLGRQRMPLPISGGAGESNQNVRVNLYPPVLTGGVTLPPPSITPNPPITATTISGETYVAVDNTLYLTPTSDAAASPSYPQAYYAQPPGTPPTNLPSYPVLIDPLGYQTRFGSFDQFWVGRPSNGSQDAKLLLPRRTLRQWTANSAATSNALISACTLLDDLTFSPNGEPENSVAGASPQLLTRQGRYNWAAVLRRVPGNPKQANLTILCFDGRPPLVNLPEAERMVVGPQLAAGQTSITLLPPVPTDPSAPPLLRKGGWIMDGTWAPQSPAVGATPANPTSTMRSNFYRVVAVSEPDATGYVTVDIDPPIQPALPNTELAPLTESHLYLFAGLTEVFVRPILEPAAQ